MEREATITYTRPLADRYALVGISWGVTERHSDDFDLESLGKVLANGTESRKQIGWAVTAIFMGAMGAVAGNLSGFIDKEVAYPIPTFGIFMVACVLLGGKGTLWGPVLGAIIFHVVKETTWTYLLGWQWVALGLILIINIVYFQQGIMGWLQTKYPEMFGIVVDGTSPEDEEREKV